MTMERSSSVLEDYLIKTMRPLVLSFPLWKIFIIKKTNWSFRNRPISHWDRSSPVELMDIQYGKLAQGINNKLEAQGAFRY